jgi:hypothetical protein
LLQYFPTTILFVHYCKHDFAHLAGKSLLEFATLAQGGGSYELDAAQNTQSLFFLIILYHLGSFC